MLCSYKLEDHYFDYQDPWSQILAKQSVLNAAPEQIVYGRDMLIDISFYTEYKEIKNANKRHKMPIQTKKNQKELNMNMINRYLT
jgi:hypothetical protein